MAESPLLDERQYKALELLLRNKPVTTVARECGVSRTAVYQWMGKPEFSIPLGRLHRGILQNTYQKLVHANEKAVRKLSQAMDAQAEIVGYTKNEAPVMGDPKMHNTRIKAAQITLDMTVRYGEQVSLEEFKAQYEERLAQLEGGL